MLQMQELIAKSIRDFKEGSIVKGRILEIRPREVLVDIGYKSEGAIPLSEFDDIETLQVGDEVEVLLERLENDEGMVVLSKEKAAYNQNWEQDRRRSFHGDGLIKGKVKAVVKGGLMVNIGVEAFLPGSQIDIIPPKDLQQFVGNTYDFKIVKINDDRKNVVLSRRELIEQERCEKRQKFLEGVKIGDTVKGAVKNLTDFGAFIDLDGMDGLLHITDMTWGRLGHPSELLKVGQELEVVVLDINREKERVSLGLKQTQKNPWDEIEERFPVGRRSKARSRTSCPTARSSKSRKASKVSSTSPNFPGPSASRARPTCSPSARKSKPSCSASTRRSRRSRSACASSNPIRGTRSRRHRYPIGSQVKGKVRNLTAYGAFVELEEGIDGMIHVSDMSLDAQDQSPDPKSSRRATKSKPWSSTSTRQNQRISLGIKQLDEDPWKEIDAQYKIGDLVKGKVSKIASFGAFVAAARATSTASSTSRRLSEDHVDKVKDVPQGRPGNRSPRHQGGQGRAPHRSLDQGRELQRRRHQERSRGIRQSPSRRRHGRPRAGLRGGRGRISPRRRQEEVSPTARRAPILSQSEERSKTVLVASGNKVVVGAEFGVLLRIGRRFGICHLAHQLDKPGQRSHLIPMRVGFEVAQHRVAFAIGLLESIERSLVIAEAAEDEGGKVGRQIIVPLGTRFEFGKAFVRAFPLAGAAVGMAKIAEQPGGPAAQFVGAAKRSYSAIAASHSNPNCQWMNASNRWASAELESSSSARRAAASERGRICRGGTSP